MAVSVRENVREYRQLWSDGVEGSPSGDFHPFPRAERFHLCQLGKRSRAWHERRFLRQLVDKEGGEGLGCSRREIR